MLVYSLFVAFAARDDLGRPDPVRDDAVRQFVPVTSRTHGGGYGDGPGAPQQRNLPPQ